MTAPDERQSSAQRERPAEAHAQHGEVNTLVDVYSKHERRIYRYCLALLRNPDDAEDATQETFTRAAAFLPNLAGDLSAYLTTVARNICCDVVRARAKKPVPLDNVAVPDRSVNPERQSVDWDVVRRMWRQLSPSERLLFAYTFAGYRYEEIASRTGMSRPSVSVGLTRARRRLRDLATAIGALGGLPLGIRRLLDRAARRANAALAGGQQVVVAVIDQVGAVAVGMLSGLVAVASGGAVVSAPPMVTTGYHVAKSDAGTSALASRSVADSTPGASAAAPGGRPAPPARPPAQPLPPALNQAAIDLQGYTTTPAGASAMSVTPSPNFPEDHIVFVTAVVTNNGCVNADACPALFRSADGGRSWTRLWSGVYQGGQVLLPPQYPSDPGVFILNPNAGLMISPAGDGVFTEAVPGATAAAVSPGSTPGHARFAVVHSYEALMTYTEGDTSAQLGPSLPAGLIVTGVSFVSSDEVLIAAYGFSTSPSGSQVPVILTCSLSAAACNAPVAPADPQGGFVYLPPSLGPGAPLVAYTSAKVYTSTDGGRSFQARFTAPANQVVAAAAADPGSAGWRLVVALSGTGLTPRPSVMWSNDMGRTFANVTGNLDGVGRLIGGNLLSDGQLLLGLVTDSTGHFSLRESPGNGAWAAPRPS